MKRYMALFLKETAIVGPVVFWGITYVKQVFCPLCLNKESKIW